VLVAHGVVSLPDRPLPEKPLPDPSVLAQPLEV